MLRDFSATSVSYLLSTPFSFMSKPVFSVISISVSYTNGQEPSSQTVSFKAIKAMIFHVFHVPVHLGSLFFRSTWFKYGSKYKTQPLQIQFLNFIFQQDGLQILLNQPSTQYFMMSSCSANTQLLLWFRTANGNKQCC